MTLTNGYTTLAHAQAQLHITSIDAADDDALEGFINQASRTIDLYTGRTFYARTETRYYDTPIGQTLYIDDDDLLTITTLTNGDAVVIAAASYNLLPANGAYKWGIRLKDSATVRWQADSSGNRLSAISIAGTWGRMAAYSADIEAACLEIVVALYRDRYGENMGGEATVTSAGVVITPAGLPMRAREILSQYRRMV